MGQARYNMQLNLLHFCHGIWLIVISLNESQKIEKISHDHKMAYQNLCKFVKGVPFLEKNHHQNYAKTQYILYCR